MDPNSIRTPVTFTMTPLPARDPQFEELNKFICGCLFDSLTNGGPFANGWNAALRFQSQQSASHRLPMPINVIFHNPATIVFWDDGDKTVVKCQPGDTFSAEAGLTAAMLKKYMGNDNTFNKIINEWLARASYASVPELPEAKE